MKTDISRLPPLASGVSVRCDRRILRDRRRRQVTIDFPERRLCTRRATEDQAFMWNAVLRSG
ncbi:MAG: hypothetical protein AAF513_14410 [Pseudomonadota bacterium]